MPTPAQFRSLVDHTLQVARLLLQSYRAPGSHATSRAEQQTLEHVQFLLQETFAEVSRLLLPAQDKRRGSRDVANGPAPEPSEPEAASVDAAMHRRARP